MDIIQTIANRLGGNRGLAEKAIYLLDNYIDWNSLEEELSYLGNDEESCLEACQGEASNIEDRINADTDYNYWLILRDYFVDMENKNTVWAGLGELLLLYYRYKKENLSENMKKKVVKINESQLRQIVTESVSKILSEDKKKDKMQQWFTDMDNAQKFRDTMDYITKGGQKPKHWNKQSDETVSETYKPLGANYSDEFISNVNNSFKRQIADLQKFMNAYSDTILSGGIIDEERYDNLYNLLGEINS